MNARRVFYWYTLLCDIILLFVDFSATVIGETSRELSSMFLTLTRSVSFVINWLNVPRHLFFFFMWFFVVVNKHTWRKHDECRGTHVRPPAGNFQVRSYSC